MVDLDLVDLGGDRAEGRHGEGLDQLVVVEVVELDDGRDVVGVGVLDLGGLGRLRVLLLVEVARDLEVDESVGGDLLGREVRRGRDGVSANGRDGHERSDGQQCSNECGSVSVEPCRSHNYLLVRWCGEPNCERTRFPRSGWGTSGTDRFSFALRQFQAVLYQLCYE